MNGIHDMGGMHGFGRVVIELDEPAFHARWEQRVLGMTYELLGFGWMNVDSFRHAIERIDPIRYLTLGYYGRWLAAIECKLIERGLLEPGAIDARLAGVAGAPHQAVPQPARAVTSVVRTVASKPRFGVGDAVRARVASPPGHTRLPRYVAGRQGVVHETQPACVYPDTHAHEQGEDPQHLYNVRFESIELWGAGAETGVHVCVDLFEPYLEPS